MKPMNELLTPLRQILCAWQIGFTPTMLEQFEIYNRELHISARNFNLTAITSPTEVAIKHFADSAYLLKCASLSGSSVIDIGSGAGFPGLPLKILDPSIRLTMVDSNLKRVDFLSSLCESLSITDVQCIHARAEELAQDPDYREQFDFAVSRAVASLPMLSELTLPFIKISGALLAMKSSDIADELALSENAVKTLGGELVSADVYSIPTIDISRSVINIRKILPTPSNFPRRFAKISRDPL